MTTIRSSLNSCTTPWLNEDEIKQIKAHKNVQVTLGNLYTITQRADALFVPKIVCDIFACYFTLVEGRAPGSIKKVSIIATLVRQAACFDLTIFDSFPQSLNSREITKINTEGTIQFLWRSVSEVVSNPLPKNDSLRQTVIKDITDVTQAILERRNRCPLAILIGLIPIINMYVVSQTLQSISLMIIVDRLLRMPDKPRVDCATLTVIEMRDPYFQAQALTKLNQYRTHNPLKMNISIPQLPELYDGFEVATVVDNFAFAVDNPHYFAYEMMTVRNPPGFDYQVVKAARYFNTLINNKELVQALITSPKKVLQQIGQLNIEVFQIVSLQTIVEVIKNPAFLSHEQAQSVIKQIKDSKFHNRALQALQMRSSPKIEPLD